MTRRTTFAFLVALVGAMFVPAVPALAGGGCHSGVTTGSETLVTMAGACFTPTITHVDAGETVTFLNEDSMIHNVTGNLWGNFDDMDEGDRFSVSFEDDGVYPYACTYHPGMTGAVVVGDGEGPGNGEVIALTGPTGRAADTNEEVDASPVSATDASSGAGTATGWIGGTAIGLLVGVGAALVVMRRRRTT